jgi:hypothetical protein
VNGPCIEEYRLALDDALRAIAGDAAAARRTRGRALAVAAFINRSSTAAPAVDSIEERKAA